MFPTTVQIREKLFSQLDNKNEVDESTVVELISMLESYPFTGAVLEESRIGRLANELRKRIKNEKLSKQLKQLIRSWQSLARANGSPGQAIARPPFIPHVSPSPRVAYPAQQKGMPHTPIQSAKLSASPALQSNKSAAAVGRKGMSPGTAKDHPGSLLLQGQASPALAGCRKAPRSAPLAASGHVASPKVSSQVPSPAVPRNVTAKVTAQTLSAGSSRAASPALSKIWGHSSSPVTSSPVQSPNMFLLRRESRTCIKQGSVRTSSKIRQKKKNVDVSENSNAEGRMTPISVHSENSQDRVIGETNGRQDSDGGSSCSSRLSYYARQISHSTDMTLTKTNSNNSAGNQKELSKANISSRKRVRTNSTSPPETHKKTKTDTSLSFVTQQPGRILNGHKKSGKKSQGKAESSCDLSFVSQPVDKSALSPPLISSSSDSRAISPQVISPQSEILLQQGSNSHIFAPTLEWLAREKPRRKVKTTEQLIKDLQKKNSSSNVRNSIMTKQRMNQIEKERDVSNSVLPASLKPRGRCSKRGKKKDDSVSVPSSDRMISKNELVEHFLKTSAPSSSVDDYGLDGLDAVPAASKLDIGACSNSCSKDSFDGNFSASRQDQSESAPKDENSMDAVSSSPALPPVRLSSALTLEEIYAQLPPINYNIDWNSVGSYTVPEKATVTDERVGGLHSDHLPGINGMYDINGDWTTWQQTLTLPSYEGEPLIILPFVDLDN